MLKNVILCYVNDIEVIYAEKLTLTTLYNSFVKCLNRITLIMYSFNVNYLTIKLY